MPSSAPIFGRALKWTYLWQRLRVFELEWIRLLACSPPGWHPPGAQPWAKYISMIDEDLLAVSPNFLLLAESRTHAVEGQPIDQSVLET